MGVVRKGDLVYPDASKEVSMARKTGTPGGFREGSGRPSFLKNPVKKLLVLEPRHVKVLERIKKRERLSGQSEALRFLLDNYSFG